MLIDHRLKVIVNIATLQHSNFKTFQQQNNIKTIIPSNTDNKQNWPLQVQPQTRT
jgi:hypothetical protein